MPLLPALADLFPPFKYIHKIINGSHFGNFNGIGDDCHFDRRPRSTGTLPAPTVGVNRTVESLGDVTVRNTIF